MHLCIFEDIPFRERQKWSIYIARERGHPRESSGFSSLYEMHEYRLCLVRGMVRCEDISPTISYTYLFEKCISLTSSYHLDTHFFCFCHHADISLSHFIAYTESCRSGSYECLISIRLLSPERVIIVSDDDMGSGMRSLYHMQKHHAIYPTTHSKYEYIITIHICLKNTLKIIHRDTLSKSAKNTKKDTYFVPKLFCFLKASFDVSATHR